MRSTRILVINTPEEDVSDLTDRLEGMGYQIIRDSQDIHKPLKNLLENYPESGVYMKRLPGIK